MKCHGSATAKRITNSHIAAQKNVEQNLIEDIARRLSQHSEINKDSNKIGATKPV